MLSGGGVFLRAISAIPRAIMLRFVAFGNGALQVRAEQLWWRRHPTAVGSPVSRIDRVGTASSFWQSAYREAIRITWELDPKVCVRNLHTAHFSMFVGRALIADRQVPGWSLSCTIGVRQRCG